MDLDVYIDNPWATMLATALFSFGIAVIVWALSIDTQFWESLAVSLSIGLTINLAFILLSPILLKYLNPYLVPIPVTAIGLAVGLIIGGTIISGQPLFFYVGNYATLVLGIFFGIVGFIIFSTSARLKQTTIALTQANLEKEQQEKLLLENELKLLQAQIEPHFLFNTLSNIAGLIHTKPDAAEATLHNLTTLLRSSLKRTRTDSITMGEEIEIARAYLDIHKIRMQNRLEYSLQMDPQLELCQVTPMLMQPLIENAIMHGIDPLEEGGKVCVSAKVAEANVVIEVCDTGAGMSTYSKQGTGLTNIKKRLHAVFGANASLELSDNHPRGVITRLTMPMSLDG